MSRPNLELVPGLEAERVVQIAQFLPKHERDAVIGTACANQQAFQRPGLPGAELRGSHYLSLDSFQGEQEMVDPILDACKCLSNRVLELLPSLFTALNIEPFPVPKIPLTLVNGLDGQNGTPHADDSGDRFKISLLYYFHKAPKAFHGGALEFYNADPESPNGHSDEAIARIDHEDNLLIAFPSQTFHGITDVQCDSDDFADGRFVAVGFLGPQ